MIQWEQIILDPMKQSAGLHASEKLNVAVPKSDFARLKSERDVPLKSQRTRHMDSKGEQTCKFVGMRESNEILAGSTSRTHSRRRKVTLIGAIAGN